MLLKYLNNDIMFPLSVDLGQTQHIFVIYKNKISSITKKFHKRVLIYFFYYYCSY